LGGDPAWLWEKSRLLNVQTGCERKSQELNVQGALVRAPDASSTVQQQLALHLHALLVTTIMTRLRE
jgi:hypothetical protein